MSEENDGNQRRLKRQLALISDFKELFGTPLGKRVLSDIIKYCDLLNPAHVPGDPHSTSYNSGVQSVGLHILKRLKTDPEKLIDLIKEGEKYVSEEL